MYSYMTKKHLAEQVRRTRKKRIWFCMKHYVKKSKDDTSNTGLQREANMAAENTNSRPMRKIMIEISQRVLKMKTS